MKFCKVFESSLETQERNCAAKKSYVTREWRDMDSQTRGDFLLKSQMQSRQPKMNLAMLDTLDNGKPLREAEGDIDDGIYTFRYYAGLIKAPYGGVYDVNEGFERCIPTPYMNRLAYVHRLLHGIIHSLWQYGNPAPAMAAGNSIVFKPAARHHYLR